MSVEGTRFSVIDSSDHGGLLWITASLGLTYFGISCIVRVLISYKSFHRDSVMLIVATVSYCQSPKWLRSNSWINGRYLGSYKPFRCMHSSLRDLESLLNTSAKLKLKNLRRYTFRAIIDTPIDVNIIQAAYVGGIFFILALAASKCSVAWFIARLSPDVKHLRSCAITFWASIVWGVVGVLLLTLRCSLDRPWDTRGKCSNLVSRNSKIWVQSYLNWEDVKLYLFR